MGLQCQQATGGPVGGSQAGGPPSPQYGCPTQHLALPRGQPEPGAHSDADAVRPSVRPSFKFKDRHVGKKRKRGAGRRGTVLRRDRAPRTPAVCAPRRANGTHELQHGAGCGRAICRSEHGAGRGRAICRSEHCPEELAGAQLRAEVPEPLATCSAIRGLQPWPHRPHCV